MSLKEIKDKYEKIINVVQVIIDDLISGTHIDICDCATITKLDDQKDKIIKKFKLLQMIIDNDEQKIKEYFDDYQDNFIQKNDLEDQFEDE